MDQKERSSPIYHNNDNGYKPKNLYLLISCGSGDPMPPRALVYIRFISDLYIEYMIYELLQTDPFRYFVELDQVYILVQIFRS